MCIISLKYRRTTMDGVDLEWKPWKGFGGYENTANPVKLEQNRYGCDFYGFFDDGHDLTFQVQIKGTKVLKWIFLTINFRCAYWNPRNKDSGGTFVEQYSLDNCWCLWWCFCCDFGDPDFCLLPQKERNPEENEYFKIWNQLSKFYW